MALRHATRDSGPLYAANLIIVPSKTWNTHATASLNHLLHEAIDKILRILEHNKPPPTQDWQVPSQRLLNIVQETVLPPHNYHIFDAPSHIQPPLAASAFSAFFLARRSHFSASL